MVVKALLVNSIWIPLDQQIYIFMNLVMSMFSKEFMISP